MKSKWTFVGSLAVVLLLFLAVGLTQAQGPQPPGMGSEAGAEAAVGNVIPIQGRLTDSAGNPLNGSYSITASIYDVETGGTALCSDTETVAVNNGLFTMNVDNCTSDDIDGRQLYLGIQVGSDAEMTDRQPIYPVPYAMSLMPGAKISYTPLLWSGTYVDLEGNLGSKASWILGYSYWDGIGGKRLNYGVYAEAVGDARAYGVSGHAETSADNSEAYGLYGSADATGSGSVAYGVYGRSYGPGAGVYGRNDEGWAIYADGDLGQNRTGNGAVKAAVYAQCGNLGSSIERSFNNIGGGVSITNGSSAGRCTITFYAVINDRYFTATAIGPDANNARGVNCAYNGTSQLDCFRWNADGNGVNGGIMVVIY